MNAPSKPSLTEAHDQAPLRQHDPDDQWQGLTWGEVFRLVIWPAVATMAVWLCVMALLSGIT